MTASRTKILFVSPQPTQNVKPYRLLSKNLDILVAYCTTPDDEVTEGEEQINRGVFDYDWKQGYSWVKLRNLSPRPSLTSRFGQISWEVVSLVFKSDLIVVYGHRFITSLLAIAAAKCSGRKLFLTTDATKTKFLADSPLKQLLKRAVFRLLYGFCDKVCVPSTESKEFLSSLGVAERKIVVTPYSVDEEHLADQISQLEQSECRKDLELPLDRFLILFVGKLIARKRPLDLLNAAREIPDVDLVVVGEGPLRPELVKRSSEVLPGRVHFKGMVPYSRLAKFYVAADLLCHPADEEPWGLIVNEAMLAHRPVVVSDAVGAGLDLVEGRGCGWRFRAGDVRTLVNLLREASSDRERLSAMGEKAFKVAHEWSSELNAQRLEAAICEVMR